MAEGNITLSKKSLNRLPVIRDLEQGHIRQAEAAKQLRLSVRQIRRLLTRYRRDGEAGLTSQRLGHPSNNRLDADIRAQALNLIQTHYHDFGPTLACEKLTERHRLSLSVETTRQLMISAGLWRSKGRKPKRHHPRRERRARFGELIQIDGSPHDWFEGRAPKCTLLVLIDDATGQLMHLRFVEAETTEAYMASLRHYLNEHSRPVALYSDCHSVFRVNCEEGGLTQFGRALETLEIEAIHAHSPQAKGRVERANLTLQDRLIKEMRLRSINDQEAANAFLPIFLSDFNGRFAVAARNPEDAHRPVLHTEHELGLILARHTSRQISKDLEVQYNNSIYQIQTTSPCYTLRRAQMTVCESFDGRVTLLYKGRELPYKCLSKDQKCQQKMDAKELNTAVDKAIKRRTPYKPKANHPWRTASTDSGPTPTLPTTNPD